MILGWLIPCTDEVICAFVVGNGFEGFGDSLANTIERSFLGFSQVMLELGEEFLDRIEIGGIFGQE